MYRDGFWALLAAYTTAFGLLWLALYGLGMLIGLW